MKKLKIFLLSSIVLIIILVTGGYFYVESIIRTGFDIEETAYIKIDNHKNYSEIIRQIRDVAKVKNISSFEKVANFLDYPVNIKSGQYAITPEMDVLEVVHLLKSGKQTPVKLTFNNIRLKTDLAERISEQLIFSEEDLLSALNNPSICEKYGFNTETIGCMFIPNTYEFYWNVSLDKFLDRMCLEYKKFWSSERLAKAEKLNMTPIEVSSLAAIVEEECYFSDEYPIVAGLYINRLKKGMKLQADPTVKYAVGDFTIKRVLNKHLEVNTPYNTYIHYGLPPGPIRIPSIKAIDGVLNYNLNDYLYMCAKEDFSGRHNFAKTHAQHERNRIKYQAELNRRKIFQ
ncbi:endolytic transglycosylase MltG [Dysgonomonas sp. 216]|uniref:endolytic transglycosylase MltG n=1 Tax=Dysgonomonas sp. 216 TaxID=2302934 RepID=UPI0013D2AFE8|nr:endolytic transglycosylase MltG [Dysgonomonas sp. 216]NDW18495.1 endolytic transglycosylase MltG [Dysgonomonas sp. 216]